MPLDVAWTWTCDICGQRHTDIDGLLRDGDVRQSFRRPARWTWLHDRLVCDRHAVILKDKDDSSVDKTCADPGAALAAIVRKISYAWPSNVSPSPSAIRLQARCSANERTLAQTEWLAVHNASDYLLERAWKEARCS